LRGRESPTSKPAGFISKHVPEGIPDLNFRFLRQSTTMDKFNGHTAREIGMLCSHAGVAKAQEKWLEFAVKSLLGGKSSVPTSLYLSNGI